MYVTGCRPDGDISSSRASDKYSAKYMSAMSWTDGASDGTKTQIRIDDVHSVAETLNCSY